MENILIRKAELADLPILLEFEQQLIMAERPLDPTFTPDKFSYYDLENMIQDDQTEVLVADMDGRVVASGHVRIRQGEAYNQFDRYAFFGFMYSDPAYRGRGLNKLIMDELIRWSHARGLKEIRLQVYDDNAPAVRAYEKVGFKKHLTTMRLYTDDL